MSVSFNAAALDAAIAAAQQDGTAANTSSTVNSSVVQAAINELNVIKGALKDSQSLAQASGNLQLCEAAAFLMLMINQMQAEMSKLSSSVTTLQSKYAVAIQGELQTLLDKLNQDTTSANGMSGDDLTRQTTQINTDNANYGAKSAEGQQIQKSIDQTVQVVQGFLSQLPTGEQQFVQFMQTVIQGMTFIASLLSR